MLVDDIGDVAISNDGATILKMLEVEHPVVMVLVELAEIQDREVGDGTTSVVIIAAELLRLAIREACKYIDDKLAVKVMLPMQLFSEKLQTSGLMDDCLNFVTLMLGQYFVETGAVVVRCVRKEDLRHVAKATGATVVLTFADMEGEETFDSSFLGSADEVMEERIADYDVIMVQGTKTTSAVSVILRGANDFMLDEMERALHDAVAGGGAVEAALSVYLEYLATTLGSREQLAIAEFAES
ncbi:unnamed protein product [Ilex paraguariensis]|uniref:T-complex protein 1 subunit alpha n=1 Tax=Ilex paraguariensis TaxID=185542 RepID=A0ABC8V4X9_9AQUA